MVKAVALLLALFVLVACMLAPIFILMLMSGLSFESKFPEDKAWLVVVGGAVGAGAAYLTYRSILVRAGGFESHEVDRMWHGERKNT